MFKETAFSFEKCLNFFPTPSHDIVLMKFTCNNLYGDKNMTLQEALKKEELFSESEKAITHYILDQKEAVLAQSVHDIAEVTYTSTSSVVRVCRKIGLKGFKDFKIKYAAELERRMGKMDDIDLDFPFSKHDTALDIAQKTNVLMVDSINATYDIMTRQANELQKAARTIARANRTLIAGVGDSFLKGQVFQYNMIKINKIVVTDNVPGDNTSLASVMSPSDCALLVSYSGNTEQTYYVAKILKRRRVPLIAITSNPDSMIGRISDIVLELPKKEHPWEKQATFASQAATEYVLNTLYSFIFVMNYDQNILYRKRNITEFGDEKLVKGERN